MLEPKTLRKVGVVGSVITALCCFTPVLLILFGAVGLAALVGYLDYVLLPALLVFIGLTVYAFLQQCKAAARGTSSTSGGAR